MPTLAVIVSTIAPVSMRDAMKALPPAGVAAADFMQGETVNREGRRVAIRFKRFRFERHNYAHWGWVLDSAEFIDADRLRELNPS
jgi:hypothetical protein